ncbi:ETS homologous factor-like [Penaeus monodon]|uniref:ETS homologous factor-like n=1 Tax=Penaeus monodon TaxID=6687 RepID=UPI0018A6FB13|nr:ETS homologous factor-like [Penaeus monodon]
MGGDDTRGLGTPSHKPSGVPEDPSDASTEWDLSGEAFQDFRPYQVEEAFDPEGWNLAIDDLCHGGKQEDGLPSVRGPKNWEFLIRLLANPRSNPSLIRWEDESRAIFRLVQPYAIAKLWASRTSHAPPLSYNNFARGLRYHYNKGALEAVSEKQLVYRFGPKGLRFLRDLRLGSS